MLIPGKKDGQRGLFFSLEDNLNQRHPLYILAQRVDWQLFEGVFTPLYCKDTVHNYQPLKLVKKSNANHQTHITIYTIFWTVSSYTRCSASHLR
jgi:hypothetical protein